MRTLARIASLVTGFAAGAFVSHHDQGLFGTAPAGDHGGDPFGLLVWIAVTALCWVVSDRLTKDRAR